MRDIVLDDIAHEERRQIDTHHRIDQIEPVGTSTVELAGEQHHDLIDHRVKDEGSHSGKETHYQREDDHEHLLADMLLSPLMQPMKHRWFLFYCYFHSVPP